MFALPLEKGEIGHSGFRTNRKGDSQNRQLLDELQSHFSAGYPLALRREIAYFKYVYHLPYNKNLKTFSRQLRNHSTQGEILLWLQLRAGTLLNYTFNRQKPLGRYIVDFYCRPLFLVIEVDGSYHFEPEQVLKDKERQAILEDMGLHFLRFEEMQVRMDMEIVLQKIREYIYEYEEVHPEVKPKERK